MPQLAHMFSEMLIEPQQVHQQHQKKKQHSTALPQEPGEGSHTPSAGPIRRVLDVPYHQIDLMLHSRGFAKRMPSAEDFEQWTREKHLDVMTVPLELPLPYLVRSECMQMNLVWQARVKQCQIYVLF